MQKHTNRRAVLTGGLAFAASPLAAGTPPAYHGTQVEAVMASVAPHSCPGYQVVKADALKALCEAAGVEWRGHWGIAQ